MATEKEITYLNRTLSKDEKILGIAEYHWIVYFAPAFWTLLMLPMLFTKETVLFSLIVIIICALVSLSYYKTEMVVTTKRAIIKKGIISVKTDELRNSKIESVSFDQGILGRILGYGGIYFSGTGTTKLKFNCVKEPMFIKSKFEELIEKNSK